MRFVVIDRVWCCALVIIFAIVMQGTNGQRYQYLPFEFDALVDMFITFRPDYWKVASAYWTNCTGYIATMDPCNLPGFNCVLSDWNYLELSVFWPHPSYPFFIFVGFSTP